MATERQKALLLQNLMRLLDRSSGAVDRTQLIIHQTAALIARMVRGLPDEALLREQAWKRMSPDLLRALSAMSNRLGVEILKEMGTMTPEAVRWAAQYMEAQAGVTLVRPLPTLTGNAADGTTAQTNAQSPTIGAFSTDAPGAAARKRAQFGDASGYRLRTSELGAPPAMFRPSDLWRGGRSPSQLDEMPIRVPMWVFDSVKETKVTGFKLRDYFGDSVVLQHDLDFGKFVKGQGLGGVAKDSKGAPKYARFSFGNIDRNVRSGFLAGLTNEEIAKNIIDEERSGAARLGQYGKRLRSDALAAARTVLADFSDNLHQKQWAEIDQGWSWKDEDGNIHEGKIIQGWRFDASMDTRVCESCSFYDGKIVDERVKLPPIPLHPSCRCQVLPETATTRLLREQDRAQGAERSAVGYTDSIPPQRKGEPRAAYVKRMHDAGYAVTKSKAPGGEWLYRKRVATKADNVAEWAAELASKTDVDSRLSLQTYMGGGSPNAGAQRAEYFRRQLAAGKDPQETLVDMTRKVGARVPAQRGYEIRAWRGVDELRKEDPLIKDAVPHLTPRQAKVAERVERAKAKRSSTTTTATRSTSRDASRLTGDERRKREAELRTVDGLATWQPETDPRVFGGEDTVSTRRTFAQRVGELSKTDLDKLADRSELSDWQKGIVTAQQRMRPIREAKAAAFEDRYSEAVFKQIRGRDRVFDAANAGRDADMRWTREPEDRPGSPKDNLFRQRYQPPERLALLPDEIAANKARAALEAEGFVKPQFLGIGGDPPRTPLEKRYMREVVIGPAKMRDSVRKDLAARFTPSDPPAKWTAYTERVLGQATSGPSQGSLTNYVFNATGPEPRGVHGFPANSSMPKALRAPTMKLSREFSLDHRVVERLAEVTNNELLVLGTRGDERATGLPVAKAIGRVLPKLPEGTVVGIPWSVMSGEDNPVAAFNSLLREHANGSEVWSPALRQDRLFEAPEGSLQRRTARSQRVASYLDYPALAIVRGGRLVPLNLQDPKEALRLMRKAKPLQIDYFRKDAVFDSAF